ncbi:MAG: tRNA (N6-isopentenyl adenosine(37)-C2)-methylthiotransferase MiaB [Clostridiales bacterium]|jgi:tRNA-2-methylthio-N6-dimethylallyladenosine synthase|nr:tRNA (N6-isopentenyl adenosine(37)-C2)-methylthiotransferase MiaB [Clostridiales bacterium]
MNNTDRYIALVAGISARQPEPPRAFVRVFGCQMNRRDSEKLSDMLARMGYEPTGDERQADLALLNTCCVRESAENRAFGHMGRLKKLRETRPGMVIVVAGCVPQSAAYAKMAASYGFVDVVFGALNIGDFPELLYRRLTAGERVWRVGLATDHAPASDYETPVRMSGASASVNVMYGCDNFCSYCVVPYTRGRERSRAPGEILAEIRSLAASGVSEVTLLGQNVNSYGKGLSVPVTFAELLRGAADVPGVRRLRFMTSHPKDMSDELIGVIASRPNICKAVHLPLQSGSSRILSAMNRGYNKEDYLSLARRIRDRIPGVSVTTDIIVGFPGETEEDFADTLDVVRRVRFDGAFTFIYSKRSGTPAASLPSQTDAAAAAERFGRLLAEVNGILLENNRAKIGRTLEILTDSAENGGASGRADDGSLVHFHNEFALDSRLSPRESDPANSLNEFALDSRLNPRESAKGRYADVRITGCKTFYLTGEFVRWK